MLWDSDGAEAIQNYEEYFSESHLHVAMSECSGTPQSPACLYLRWLLALVCTDCSLSPQNAPAL